MKYNLTGRRFGFWTVGDRVPKIGSWVCVCDCGKVREVTTYQLLAGKSPGCRKCSAIAMVKPLIQRFEDKVYYSLDGCHYWIGCTFIEGYGRMSIEKTSRPAHRVSYELYKGPIPKGMFVCHHCDHPLCVNPDHLFLGTHTDNMRDMCKKGRYSKSKRSNLRKLNPNEVDEIRKSTLSVSKLSREYNVARITISKVRTNKSHAL